MSLNLATILAESAQKAPQHPALILGEHVMSYGELDGLARRFAAGLAGLGVGPGDKVALMLPNVPHFTVAYYAAQYIGATAVPLNVLLTAPELVYHLDDCDAVAVVTWEGFLKPVTEALPQVQTEHLVVARTQGSEVAVPSGAHDMMALAMSAAPIREIPATSPDDTAVILYTSGTTGRAKGAELSHFNLFYNAQYVATKLVGLDHSTMGLLALPLFHTFGQTVHQNAVLFAGGTNVLLPRFEPEAAMGAIQKHKVNLFAGVPTMYFALLNHGAADQYDLSSLEYCLSGGSSMPAEVMHAFDNKYGVKILEGYGLSETSPVASFNVLDRERKPGSVGLPLWGVQMRLEDPNGEVVTEPGQAGEICIKGHNVMKGYYKRPDATAAAIRDGWFHSGDIAVKDEEGYYFIVDRLKDMIIRGGYNVYPREIEEVLYAHPAVAEAAVVGVPDPRLGEEVKAVVALKPGQSASSEELLAFCKERIAANKYPRQMSVVESLPKGPTGKILKRKLRE